MLRSSQLVHIYYINPAKIHIKTFLFVFEWEQVSHFLGILSHFSTTKALMVYFRSLFFIVDSSGNRKFSGLRRQSEHLAGGTVTNQGEASRKYQCPL